MPRKKWRDGKDVNIYNKNSKISFKFNHKNIFITASLTKPHGLINTTCNPHKIDLRSGYHQIRLDPDTIPLTAFRTKYGFYKITELPFGFANALRSL
eukprot:contig_2254_g408